MIRVRACAKINLDLRIAGVRADGYHELRTTFQSIALHDVLTVSTARGGFAVRADDSGCPAHDNIVQHAAEALWRAAGRTGPLRGIRVTIDKRIPMAAGLGGGSADAAATLRALAVLWGMKRPARLLEEVAAGLGADVPYFLEGGTAAGEARGDELTRLHDAPRRWVVLVVPPFGVSTREAYGWWDARHPSTRVRRRRHDGPINDLQAAVMERHPEIGTLVRRLQMFRPELAAMSGSGSAVFGLFRRQTDAEHAAVALAGSGPRVFVTRTIGRAEYGRRTRPVLARK